MLRATTACNFSSLIWPAGSAPAALASLLFDPPEPQIIGKTQCFATFLPFSHLHLLSSYSFSSTLLSSNLSLLSASSLLCFSSVHIVGSLTAKLTSMIGYRCKGLETMYSYAQLETVATMSDGGGRDLRPKQTMAAIGMPLVLRIWHKTLPHFHGLVRTLVICNLHAALD